MSADRNRIVQLMGELLIPFLGYFWWNWSLYFIFLFMFLDLISYHVLYYYKWRKIADFHSYRSVQPDFKQLTLHLVTLIVFLIGIFLGYSALLNHLEKTSESAEILRFITYRDMGFAQGYVLIPFIALQAWMSFRVEFLMKGKFATQSISALFREYLQNDILSVLLLAVFSAFYFFGVQWSLLYLFVGLLALLVYRLVEKRV